MASLLLTDVLLRKLKPNSDRQIDVFDSKVSGFAVRISPHGTKTFNLLYRIGGRARRLTIGRYPLLSLSEARAKAEEALKAIGEGLDPAAIRIVARETYTERLFPAVVADFVNNYAKRKTRGWRETERLLTREFSTPWKHRQIHHITKQDLNRLIDDIVDRGSPSTANHAFAAVRKLLSWATERGYIVRSPAEGLRNPSKLVSRDRVLNDRELAAVWRTAKSIGYPFGPVVQLLILTAQRRGEVIGMRWSELDLEQGIWTIPPQRTKSNRRHQVPLSAAAVALLKELPCLHDELVFPARGNPDQPSSGFSKWKRALDRTSNTSDWTLHDLRRTVATRVAELEVAPHIIERMLNQGVFIRFKNGSVRTGRRDVQ
jgi:integrase